MKDTATSDIRERKRERERERCLFWDSPKVKTIFITDVIHDGKIILITKRVNNTSKLNLQGL